MYVKYVGQIKQENRLYNKSIFLLDLSKYVIIMYVFESMYKAKVGRLCNI